ncbi:sigma-70 family RNA polymerase sigma factor [Phytohabitans sp. ZYX-F-186]|uniref:Sigma-70 family RNA polymerase sigma factor n=1 Tax=Phytohabitans maris TaxID=3071409 RepID=A0ABU0ZRL3_9ACTN|nr:sigma-70 family RNA polymerase sigma factor [Phytohabitans sp. ZYX-F-186]MDQ7908587.1 sigma-70 family RNA polymerase sigma factor [Phytohabitans sp. ZYX-F-186]
MGRHARLEVVVDAATVTAARDGDKRSLDDLVTEHLPLVYNIVGRALDGHPDVDDVVQETMLRVVRKLKSLRDSSRFRAWLVAIAMQQVRARARARREMLASGLEDVRELADPTADFVDATIAELGLTGQRREVAEATRWLDPADRRLLALWWQEAAGELSRAQLAAALGLTAPHAAVRVQRMKSQLQGARAVVRALWSDRHCTGLIDLLEGWDAKPSPLWRKRLIRHTRGCAECGHHWADQVPAERLLAGVALLPVPLELSARLGGAHGVVTGTTAEVARAGAVERLLETVSARPGVRGGLLAGAVVLAVGIVYLIVPHEPSGPAEVAAPPPAVAPPVERSPSPWEPKPGAPRPVAQERAPVPARIAPKPSYGSNVDSPDPVPPADRVPGELPRRPEGRAVVPVDGEFDRFGSGRSGTVLLRERGHQVTVEGQGYFAVRWQVSFHRCGGEIAMPTWTGLTGKLFHAGSGGGRRLDDRVPGAAPGMTWMGVPERDPARVPAGAQQMWQVEFYYLDGTVTLHHNEVRRSTADYDLAVAPTTWRAVNADLTRAPRARWGVQRYGKVRDTGTDRAPVPQYLTRSSPADPRRVPQRSAL